MKLECFLKGQIKLSTRNFIGVNMEIIDYASQSLPFGDLLEKKGVSLDAAEKLEVRRHLYEEITGDGDVPKQNINLGNWSVTIQGLDEAVNLMEALGGAPQTR